MNQLDWEKMQEIINIKDVARITRSEWFVAQSEYIVNNCSWVNGSFTNTQAADNSYERFREDLLARFDAHGIFEVDASCYPLSHVQSFEIQMKYRSSDAGERWYLKAYNWTSLEYSDSGFNSTTGHMPIPGWNFYAISLLGDKWHSYVTNNGRIYLKIVDEKADISQTTIDIDFLGVRAVIDGTLLTIQNKGSRTVHIVSIWVNNVTSHKRYDADAFANSGEALAYPRGDIQLPGGQHIIKVVTERGNTAVYTGV